VDFEVNDTGSIVQIIPLTPAASEWLDENVESEGWQWMGNALCIDPRSAEAVIDGMVGDGLEMGVVA
jgi:hypothetical protein